MAPQRLALAGDAREDDAASKNPSFLVDRLAGRRECVSSQKQVRELFPSLPTQGCSVSVLGREILQKVAVRSSDLSLPRNSHLCPAYYK